MVSRQTGQVMAIAPGGHTVTVEVNRGNMCSHGGCSHRIFPDTNMEMQVEAANVAGALLGDLVEISFETREALWAAFLVYIVPILLGIGSYLAADALLFPYPVALAVVAAIGAMVFGLRRGNRLQTEYTVVSRLDPASIQLDQGSCAGCPFR